MKDLYDLTKKQSRKKSSASKPIKDESGNKLTKQKDQLKRWGEYFKELLNRPPLTDSVTIPETHSKLEVNIAKPSKEAIAGAIRKQQNGKAPSPVGIPAEVLKPDMKISTQMLYGIVERV